MWWQHQYSQVQIHGTDQLLRFFFCLLPAFSAAADALQQNVFPNLKSLKPQLQACQHRLDLSSVFRSALHNVELFPEELEFKVAERGVQRRRL